MKRKAGFTLIELVIVVMILGILAGVAAPKLFDTSNTAKINSLKQSLAVVRDAIELYNARYEGLPTDATTLIGDLEGEFIRKFPANPINGFATVKPIATVDDATGWMYTNGQFIANTTGYGDF